ncbi:MAG: cytochrome c oxidase assembly protein [Gammaproteobacteria bacterium]|nr:cytochrome c oxidase assembly protein [Gammaproteobacteria bacterium]MDH5262525.1 cytochrome c oxidase assembly protein [Gammaproteobacteria bacterium]MDH5583802.1 cytochrome c oxidase assembly protein [Gammaproteobacteria bacterium]
MLKKNEHRSLVVQLLIMAVAMFGFGFLLVPLYDVFCEITGFGGRTNAVAAVVEEAPDLTREIRVEFVTTVNEYAQFEFAADADSMTVSPGKMYYATFTAKNLAAVQKVAQAVPSVAPVSAAEHFTKIECFCFTSQEFMANEERAMPLQFIVNPDLPDYVDTITLQYTFFDTAPVAANLEN